MQARDVGAVAVQDHRGHAVHGEVDREPEHQRLQERRGHEHEHHPPITHRLPDLLAEDRPELDPGRWTAQGAHASLRGNRVVERASTTTAKTATARRSGQSTARPLPLSRIPRSAWTR